VVLIALGTLLILPVDQDARSEPRPTETDPAQATEPAVEKTPKPSTKASKETRQSAYEKLALNKLDIKEPGTQRTGSYPGARTRAAEGIRAPRKGGTGERLRATRTSAESSYAESSGAEGSGTESSGTESSRSESS
jgi:hypothetical protein